MDKCCGTCKWAEGTFTSTWKRICTIPRPDSDDGCNRRLVDEMEGTTCPCYDPKTKEAADG